MAARTTAIVSFAIFFIFGVGCSWRGAVAGCGSWGGCVDNGSSCGVVLKLSNRFFGALAGACFFFGFRPRLLGIGKGWHGSLRSLSRDDRLCLQEYRDAGLLFRIIRSCVHERADPPHALALLRPRREAARSGRAAEKREEVAPF